MEGTPCGLMECSTEVNTQFEGGSFVFEEARPDQYHV